MTVYNKLVRDRIPEIIEKQGKKPTVRTLSGEQYIRHLEAKLDEEVGEYHRDKNAEELADILEVVYALADAIGCTKAQLQATYEQKHADRGGFEKRIFLISSE